MKDKINQLSKQFTLELPAVKDFAELTRLEIRFLGRKAGELTKILRGLKDMPEGQRKELGQLANTFKTDVTAQIAAARRRLEQPSSSSTFDVTVPGIRPPVGHLHLVTHAIREIQEIFERIGFYRVRYPEIEWDYYAFESLNMPPDHPARDEWETFFIDTKPVGQKGQRVLTPHTSSGQVREMEKKQHPIRMMNISKCYRRQIDVSHLPMFHQFEGLLVDKDVTVADLKGTLDYFVKSFFGSDRKVRIRPNHFQFTEPSFEVDISVDEATKRMGKNGWLELGGAGMVHPNVLKAGGIDPKKYSGFAFGWGVERTYLMKAGLQIPDIRMMYQNDLRFLRQF